MADTDQLSAIKAIYDARIADLVQANRVARDLLEQSQAEVALLRSERLAIQRAIARTQTGGDGSEDDDLRYTVDEIVRHIERLRNDSERPDGARMDWMHFTFKAGSEYRIASLVRAKGMNLREAIDAEMGAK